jgi:probable HAF family extracellular repeat protein
MTNSEYAPTRDWRRSLERGRSRGCQGMAALVLALGCGVSHVSNAQQYSLSDLGNLGGTYSAGTGINAGGEVTGLSYLAGDLQYRAFLYSNGSMRDLGTLGGTYSQGQGINAGGEVTGEAFTANLNLHAFLYSNGSMRDLGTLGGSTSVGYGINAGGEVVGVSDTAGGGGVQHAFLYSHGKMLDLNALDTASPLARYVTLNDARAINDKSWIVANGTDSRTALHHAYLLKPSGPEELLEQLKERVVGVGPGRRLENRVDEALADFEAGDIAATCAVLERFRHEVHELADYEAEDIAATGVVRDGSRHEEHEHSGKKIDPTLAKALIADAETIEALIGCAQQEEHHER